MDRPSFTLGIEEEYLIVDRETRALVRQPPEAFMDECGRRLGDQVTGEYLQCQVEVGTKPHQKVSDAIADLAALRAGVAEVADGFGYAPIAASTHPFGHWRDQTHTRKERYDALRTDLGQAVRRMVICGMHIHVGIEEDDQRIDLMNQIAYFLPHLLALSCSSPFWEEEDTGLSSYRLTVFDALPRTGLPDYLDSFAEYRRLVDHLVAAGCIEDATRIWWDVRPSDKFPTLEQRITDVCPLLSDVAAIAALYQCLLAYLYRLKSANQRWRIYPRTLLMENRWRAQRYGTSGQLVDQGRRALVDLSALAEELVELVGEEAELLGCEAELQGVLALVARGSSADRQRQIYAGAKAGGASDAEAMGAVVDALIDEFRRPV
ncbi:carboxylate-amine ligase [Oceanomicrobium pacificus]|uniref:Putative glutamate--cysteine ligase 2 n=1 Tax=Oceanomicrobium pacificus TaxID=2692916 RepID=A0A6B0TX87_9RHOB|nr:carboxylate-amine ligase [Oceanomicrobium pacificus]MXU66098.1 carboxylate-amine ligase [Oceanomicrobium pacificus]